MAHYCLEHKTPFFKSPKMRGYAHPIVDADGEPTGKWCNEPKEQAKEQEKPFTYSPEKSASIETQVAVKASVDLWVAGKLQEDSQIVGALKYWIASHLDGSVREIITADVKQQLAVNPTTDAVNKVLQPLGMAIPVDKPPLPNDVEGVYVVYATKTQLEQLTALYKQYPGEIEKLKVKYGFQKKLTKANAGKLIAELIVVKEAKND